MATSVLKFISKIPGQSDEYTTPVFQDRDWRHKDCLSVTQDVLFGKMLPGAMGTPPPKTREYMKRR